MTWAGLSNVRDSAGLAVNDYSALSDDSGFDFAGPTSVPEPATSALIVIGLFVVTVRLRRNRASNVGS